MDTQFGKLVTVDFEEHTLTFKMNEDAAVKFGEYAIMPIEEYEKLKLNCTWFECSEKQPEDEGVYLVENKYNLIGEYHKFGEFAGKWTADDKDGFESEIYVTKWKLI